MITSLHHVRIAMPPEREDMAREFYSDILGLEEHSPDDGSLAGRLLFRIGEQYLEIASEEAFVPTHSAYPVLAVTDLDTLSATLEERMFALDWGEPEGSARRCFVHDPFGNRLGLVERS